MKKRKNIISVIVGIGLLVFILIRMIAFTVYENEYAVVKNFGKIKEVQTDAGLHLKTPFVDSVSFIPKSTQLYDLPASEAITSDKKTMIVDAYILWHITDPKAYTQSLNASQITAEGRIDVITYNAIKTTISSMTQDEVISSRDENLDLNQTDAAMDDVEIKDLNTEENPDVIAEDVKIVSISEKLLDCIGTQCDQYGIAIKDVQIKVLDLPDENKTAVHNRMITERNNIAAAYTAQGNSEAQIIKNTTNKEVAVVKSEAEAKAAATIAEGEAEYMRILANAYNDESKADFYLYSLSLDTARESLKNGNTTLFLDSDSPIAKIFEG